MGLADTTDSSCEIIGSSSIVSFGNCEPPSVPTAGAGDCDGEIVDLGDNVASDVENSSDGDSKSTRVSAGAVGACIVFCACCEGTT